MVVSAIIRAIQGTYRQCICCTGTPLLHENHILTLGDLKEIGREVREILSDALARHPASSGAHLYLPRTMSGREMKSLKQTYREVKIKTAIHLHNFDNTAMKASAKADRV